MFPWSAVFSLEPKVPGQRTSEELVTNTLMLELGATVKRTERMRLERAAEGQRRRRSGSCSSSSAANYGWLANVPSQQPYQLTPNDLLELQELCAKVPPARCGPVIVRFRRLVSQMEPEVYEVPRLFRSVLHDCLEEVTGGAVEHNAPTKQQRSKSLSLVTFRSKFQTGYFFGGSGPRGSRGDLQQQVDWSDEEGREDDDDDDGREREEEAIRACVRKGRSRSMPEIAPLEQSAHG
ncbi:RD3 domain-containing protein [Syngnathoides biaculeatus]|uniref:RD3 domain-containing protein n=1 Tax=Syngnathoides biaculeatus TaxID=300417 RepID=UPI002ADDCB3F|nr:RD3 domain-containing protein [Syngnathoides biaculeatus]XP_061691790.1 RD3 domain-containing protein [Syngnathoides biaculeatus]XP_061691791.1 RD3 domain-containing protein [Syngnathoides biaculeatus]XP_061691793.1 RD3 domain-containing protein [Syngnathoides biaculeatus]